MPEPATVLYVDGDQDQRERVSSFLGRNGEFDVTTETDVEAAIAHLDAGGIECIVSDYDMADGDGLSFLSAVRERWPDLPFILFTGKGSEAIASDAISAGVTDYVQKVGRPDTYRVLANRIRNAVESYRTERALRESEKRYRTLVERSHDAIYIYRDDRFRFVNERFCDLTGRCETELLSIDIWELIHPDDVDRVRRFGNQRMAGESAPSTYRARVVTADGESRHCEFSVQRIDFEDDYAVLGSIRDVTDRVERQSALERYETIVQASGDPVYTLDAGGYVTFINERMEEMTGYEAEEVLGEHVSIVVDEDDVAAGEALIRDILASEERDRRTYEIELITADGERILCENHVALLPFEDGEFRGTTGVLRDIREREERARELERQNERLAEFARVVGHDLRNPLNVATLSLEVAREDPTPEHFDRTEAALERMEELIADLQLIAQGEAVEVEQRPVSLASVVEVAWATTETADATLETSGDLGVVHCDESRTRQLLENLFRNAVEHAGESVAVRVRATEEGFAVEDDGPGLPEETDEELFSMGYSTDSDGTGYGLAIARDVARAHGWDLRTGSGDLGGACFEVTGAG